MSLIVSLAFEYKFSHKRRQQVSKDGIIGDRGIHKSKWYNHMPAKEIRDKLGVEKYNNYFKFCTVRNPYDRIISGFYALSDTKNVFDRDSEDLIKEFRSWVFNKNNWFLNEGLKIHRKTYKINGKIAVDFFIKYENLYKDLKHVCNKLGIPFEPEKLKSLKSGNRRLDIPIEDYYDSKTKKFVEKTFEFELRTFNYG